MKNNITKTAILALMAMPIFTSCELDQFPTTAAVDEQIWTDYDDAHKFELGLMAQFRGIATMADFVSDIQVDYYQPGKGYGNRNGETYRWTFDSGEMAGYWSSLYSVISQVNYFLANIERTPIANEEEQKIVEHYKGEAYFIRAFCYFNLAQRYCKDYDPETAADEQGLPIVKVVDIDGRPSRATLEETKQFIDEDLKKADELFQYDEANTIDTWAESDDENAQLKYKYYRQSMDKNVLRAFMSRYYLWTEDYDKAFDSAVELCDGPDFPLASSLEEFAEMWKNDAGTEFIYVPNVNQDERVNYGTYHNFSAVYTNYYGDMFGGGIFMPDFLPSKALLDAYDNADIRKTVFFETVKAVFEISYRLFYATNIVLLNKYPGNPALVKEGENARYSYYNAPKPFRIAEQYLIAAEAAYKMGNEGDAIDYLTMLRDARNAGATPTTLTGDALFKVIQDEWYREFVGEGFRLNCLKRWHLGFTRSGATQNNSIIATDINEIAIKVEPDNKRFVWEIPTNDLETNPNIGNGNWY